MKKKKTLKGFLLLLFRILLVLGSTTLLRHQFNLGEEFLMPIFIVNTFLILQVTKKYTKQQRINDFVQLCCILVLLFAVFLLRQIHFTENNLIFFVAVALVSLTMYISSRFSK